MSVFRRRKKAEVSDVPGASPEEGFVDDLDEQDRAYEDQLLLAELEAAEAAEGSAPAAPARPQGPWDVDDAPDDDVNRIDLGALRVPVPPDTEVRVDVGPDGAVVAATLVQGQASVQVNVFAAPRTEGIWPEVLVEIEQSLAGGGGQSQRAEGSFGPELQALIPTEGTDANGQQVVVGAPVRFVGVDGPRWFVRALFAGTAAVDQGAAAPLEQALRDVVVVRGSDPMAVRDALPLRLPADVQAQADAQAAAPSQQPPADPLQLAERGPEITEVR